MKISQAIEQFGKGLLFLGVDLRKVNSLRNLPRYLADRARWRNLGGDITRLFPALGDYKENAGNAKGHYFHQDLLVARFVSRRNPRRHIDVGSSIDGFVAHVASFRELEVFDIRDLEECGHDNIKFIKKDLMSDRDDYECVADSISCLHALEHFGLGRYGDIIDPAGHVKGIKNLIRMLEPGGILYLSFPIGISDEIHFNAHRVFAPSSVLSWQYVMEQLELLRFDWVDDEGYLHADKDVRDAEGKVRYGCGIYTFKKRV